MMNRWYIAEPLQRWSSKAAQTVKALRTQPGKDIWLLDNSESIHSFLEAWLAYAGTK